MVINSVAIESSIAVGIGDSVRTESSEGVENIVEKGNGHDGGVEGGGMGVSVRVGEGGEGVEAGHVPDMLRDVYVLYRYLGVGFPTEIWKT